jgi:hypothetical protein
MPFHFTNTKSCFVGLRRSFARDHSFVNQDATMSQKRLPPGIVSFFDYFFNKYQFHKKNIWPLKSLYAGWGAGSVAIYGLLVLFFSFRLHAQPDDLGLQPVPEPPPLPSKVESGQTLDPDVTIIQGPRHTVHEYRVNGKLYAIKVVPKNAPSYYLVDTNGDGSLDFREELTGNFFIPQWVLFSW